MDEGNRSGSERGGSRYPEKRAREAQKRGGIPAQRKKGQEKSPGAAGRKEARAAAGKGREELPWQERLRSHRKLRLNLIIGGILAVAAVVYGAAAIYFSSHFYEGTHIYGFDCSQMTAQEVKEKAADILSRYTLTLQERRGVQEMVSAGEIGLRFVDTNSVDRMLKAQRAYFWPLMALIRRDGSEGIAFTYDREKAEKRLDELDCFSSILAVKPRDAYIDSTEEGFVIIPEEIGTTLDEDRAREAVFSALDRGMEELSFEEEGCYQNPQVYRDDPQMNQDVEAMNDLISAHITYDFGDRTEVVDASILRDWVRKSADGTFVIDDVKAEEYVEELARKYDTFGMERQFYTSYGTTVSLVGGDYGWAIDQDATTVALLSAIQKKEDAVIEPEYVYTAMSRDTNDIGYTYVEICISQQRMICYKDGAVIVDTPVVTGNPNRGNATPSGGVWSIDAKMRNYVLVGEGYQAPVDYWMPFNGDVGIHDLKTRAYFGGSIYLSNGSHGCVNTPYDQVSIIYNAVSIGTPVIVYDSP